MTSILKSASKIVFIVMALAVVAGLFTKVIDPKDFMVLASMSFVFYFSKPIPQVVTEVHEK
jgi:hypothetical protein